LRNQPNVITSITELELWRGAFLSANPSETQAVTRVTSHFSVLPFDSRCARLTGELWTQLERGGMPLEARDLMIAGTALSHDAVLYTRNLKHFQRVPGLKVKRW